MTGLSVSAAELSPLGRETRWLGRGDSWECETG